MPFVCFMGPPNTRRLLSLLVLYETVDKHCLCSCKKNVTTSEGLTARKTGDVDCFDTFINAEVIVASLCRLPASLPLQDTKGIQASQTWHTRLRQDGPPHESV